MTLPEHAICSLMIAQLGCRQQWGWKATLFVVAAGISPDTDVATKLISDPLFWKYHHALGHSLISITVLTALIGGIGSWFLKIPFRSLFFWCWLAAFVHDLTDIPYWWGVKFLWPFSSWEPCLEAIEYLDLFVLGMWLMAAIALYKWPNSGRLIATWALSSFAAYVTLRYALPKPEGWLKFVMGGWIYAPAQNTPLLDWW